MLKLPMQISSEPNGFLIDLQVGQSDWRDNLTYEYEDGSREQWSISNGSQLKMWFLEEWVWVRCETMLPRSEYRVWLYFDHPKLSGSDGLELKRNEMYFRWK
jgi:hypothetical protein